MTTETMVKVECPSCSRAMAFDEANHSFRCHACNPIPVNVPICATQKCKQPLTKLGEPWNCWICLKCNDHPAEVNKREKETQQRKRVYVDQKLTTEDVTEMIQKEMASVKDMIRDAVKPDYPPTRAEIQTMTDPEIINAKPETYLQKAKRLHVATHLSSPKTGMRKKDEIESDITAKELKAANSVPDNETEYARGLTEEDMMEG